MAINAKSERSLLAHGEIESITKTHHPALIDQDEKALLELQSQFRGLRAKERTFVRDLHRSIRGKDKQRGASFPGNVERPSRRKQAFANALKRINSELARRREIAARAAAPKFLDPGRTSREGVRPAGSKRIKTSRTRLRPQSP